MRRLHLETLVGLSVFALALNACDSGSVDNGSGGAGGGGGSGGGKAGSGGSGQPCGNGGIDEGEDCDGTNLKGKDCDDYEYDGGTLACDDCAFDFAGCIPPAGCGNGLVEDTLSEQCDGSNLNGQNCRSAGTPGEFVGGKLACARNCRFDTSECTPEPCGNGSIDAGEDCDGTNLNGNTCSSVPGNYNGGNLTCDNCVFDVSACSFDPCIGRANPCETAGIQCHGDNLVVCAENALGCLVETNTDCTTAPDGYCDSAQTPDRCVTTSPCIHECDTPGPFACAGTNLSVCVENAFLCRVTKTVDCKTAGGFCDESGAAPACTDLCAGLILCDGDTESSQCIPGTEILEKCTLDGNNCLVRELESCIDGNAGGFCDETAGPKHACTTDPCFGTPSVCPIPIDGRKRCINDFVLAECTLDAECYKETLTDCVAAYTKGYCKDGAIPECAVAVCENSVVEPHEYCDPSDGVACDTDCTFLMNCGDGEVNTPEECDPPNSTTCDNECQRIPDCGDGHTDNPEQCDPPDGTFCSDDCKFIIKNHCNDGIINGRESCDLRNFGMDEPPSCQVVLQNSQANLSSVGCTPKCHYDLSGCTSTGDICTDLGWYENGECDPCAIYGGIPDSKDCETACAMDGFCFQGRMFEQWLCVTESPAKTRDPDCHPCNGESLGEGELCDGSEFLPSINCAGFGFGDIKCSDSCFPDYSTCSYTELCGNGTVDFGEECEPPNTNDCDDVCGLK